MITQTNNMELVNSILTHPDIWKDIAGGLPLFDVPYVAGMVYFLVNDGDGVIVAHKFRDGCKIHPTILPEYRGRAAYVAVEDAIQELFHLGYPSIYAEIDRKLRHITMFARTLGFRLLESADRDLFIRRDLDS